MRIYSNGVNEYTVDSDTLNHSVALPAGTNNTVVQSWDICGNVGKTFVTITVSSGNN